MEFEKYSGLKNALAKSFSLKYRVSEDDLKSEAEVAWIRAKQDWDESRGASFSTFAWLVVQRALNAYCLKNLPPQYDVQPEMWVTWENPETTLIRQQMIKRVHDAVTSIPNGRIALEWLLGEEDTATQVAEVHGVSVNQLQYAVRRVREKLAKDCRLKEWSS